MNLIETPILENGYLGEACINSCAQANIVLDIVNDFMVTEAPIPLRRL